MVANSACHEDVAPGLGGATPPSPTSHRLAFRVMFCEKVSSEQQRRSASTGMLFSPFDSHAARVKSPMPTPARRNAHKSARRAWAFFTFTILTKRGVLSSLNGFSRGAGGDDHFDSFWSINRRRRRARPYSPLYSHNPTETHNTIRSKLPGFLHTESEQNRGRAVLRMVHTPVSDALYMVAWGGDVRHTVRRNRARYLIR